VQTVVEVHFTLVAVATTPKPKSNVNCVVPGKVLKLAPVTVATVPPVYEPDVGDIVP
jgi:hypothetical protein